MGLIHFDDGEDELGLPYSSFSENGNGHAYATTKPTSAPAAPTVTAAGKQYSSWFGSISARVQNALKNPTVKYGALGLVAIIVIYLFYRGFKKTKRQRRRGGKTHVYLRGKNSKDWERGYISKRYPRKTHIVHYSMKY